MTICSECGADLNEVGVGIDMENVQALFDNGVITIMKDDIDVDRVWCNMCGEEPNLSSISIETRVEA